MKQLHTLHYYIPLPFILTHGNPGHSLVLTTDTACTETRTEQGEMRLKIYQRAI